MSTIATRVGSTTRTHGDEDWWKLVVMYEVILRRVNGRFVKAETRRSRYGAKKLRDTWALRYDSAYYVEVVKK